MHNRSGNLNNGGFMEDKNLYYTKVKVIFNDGSEFEGDEVQVSLVCGFTAKYRGGVKETLFLEYVPLEPEEVSETSPIHGVREH